MSSYSPEEMEAHMGEWKSWMGGLAEQGKLAGGLPLSKEGRQVTSKSGAPIDGPFAEGKEVVGGYLILNAETWDGAVEIARECPIFVGDTANVEVREMMAM